MKATSFVLMTASALTAIASPAMADRRAPDYDNHRYHHRDWSDRYDHRYDSRDHRYYGNRYGWRPVTTYSSYPVTNYREVRCTNSTNPLGLIIGGIAGGALGSTIGSGSGQVVAIAGGALAGSMIGNRMVQQRCTEEVFREVPVGRPVSWSSRNEAYTVVPVREYTTNGNYCREYQAYALVGNQRSETYGTACLQPDGTWQIVN